MKNTKPKFTCKICKGDQFLMDFPGLQKVLEMWSYTSSTPIEHVVGTLSTSDVKVGKNNRTVKFPCMLCEGDHYTHIFPRMDEAYYLLEKIQLPTSYHKISPKPSLVYGLVNPVPSPVSPVDQVVNMVSSSVETLTQVVDPFPSPISLTLHLKSAKVFDSVRPTLHLKSETQVTDPVLSSVIPSPHSKS
jgi:hypothetical protein